MSPTANHEPIVSKIYCSSARQVFMVRNRPRAVNGGGFVVTNSRQEVVFKAEGCGTLGTKGELVLRDGTGATLLFIRRKGGMMQAMSSHRQWKGYTIDYEGADKFIFSLREPSYWTHNTSKVKIYMVPKSCTKDWDFEVKGSFVDRDCNVYDREGNSLAQVQMGIEGEVELMGSKDVYYVVVQPGFDQAFVFGVMAVLDNINNQSTAC